jgi:hypothetical protein
MTDVFVVMREYDREWQEIVADFSTHEAATRFAQEAATKDGGDALAVHRCALDAPRAPEELSRTLTPHRARYLQQMAAAAAVQQIDEWDRLAALPLPK